MNITSLLNLPVEKLLDFLQHPEVYEFIPVYLSDGIQVDVVSDAGGSYIKNGDREFGTDKSFVGLYDQPLKCFYDLIKAQPEVKSASAYIYYNFDDNGESQLIQLSGDDITPTQTKSLVFQSPDGSLLYKREQTVKWKKIEVPHLKVKKIWGDFRVKKKVAKILHWLEEKYGTYTRTEILTMNLSTNRDVSAEIRDQLREELKTELTEFSNILVELLHPELTKFRKLTGYPGKILAVSPTEWIDIKDDISFQASKIVDSTPYQEISKFYTRQLERIYTLFDFGETKGDITRVINSKFDGDALAYAKEFIKTSHPISLREKTIAILEYIVEELKHKFDNSDLKTDPKFKVFCAYNSSRCQRLADKLKRTVKGDEIVAMILGHVIAN